MRLSVSSLVLPWLLAATFLTSGCSRGEAKSAEQPKAPSTTVRFATSAGTIPVPFGVKKGFFAQEGIDLKIVNVPGGVEAVIAAAAGEAEAGGMGSPILVGAAMGVPIKIIGAPPAPGQHFILVSRPEIKTLEELKGKRVSPGRPGQGTIQAFKEIIKAHRLKISDFQVVDAGNSATAFAALQAGKVDAVITSEMYGYKAEQDGFGKVLERAEEYFGKYQHSFVFGTEKFLKTHPQAARHFLAAYRKSVQYIIDHPEEAIQFGVKELNLEEKPLRRWLAKELPGWDASGKVDLEATDNALGILKDLGELDKNNKVKAAQLVDLSYLPE